MKAIVNKFTLALVLMGLAVQGSFASTDITVESYRPVELVVTQKAATFSQPRIDISHSIILGAPVESKQVLQTKALAAQRDKLGVPLQIGFDRSINDASDSNKLAGLLKWHTNQQGSYSAAILLVSPQATGSRVILDIERLHAAARVRFIGEQTGEEVTVTGEEIINTMTAAQQLDTRYVGPYLDGEAVIIEIHLPAGVRPEDTRIAIPALSHIYMTEADLGSFREKTVDLSCMVSAACEPAYDLDGAAVAAIRFQEGSNAYVCTGTLLNDTAESGTANFITANHCISTPAVASTVETRWFYKTASCQSTVLDGRDTTVRGGADLLFTQTDTDTTLLRLKGALPQGVNYTGWKTAPLTKDADVTVLHHPDYSAQKITKGWVETFADCQAENEMGEFLCSWMPDSMGAGNYVTVYNIQGVVAGGSSGSGLLATMAGKQYYVGTLRGGASSCSTPQDPDFYGRFDIAYEAGLSKWLNPEQPAAVDGDRSAIYRLFHTVQGTHFFTASAAERDSVVSKYPAYIYEGIAFYTYPETGADLSPVYRFFNSVTGAHFYTINQAEKESVQNKLPGFIYEGIAWYASTKSFSGAEPLYRFFNEKTGTHFYTINAQEKDNIIAKYPSYLYEGIAYYVWTGR